MTPAPAEKPQGAPNEERPGLLKSRPPIAITRKKPLAPERGQSPERHPAGARGPSGLKLLCLAGYY